MLAIHLSWDVVPGSILNAAPLALPTDMSPHSKIHRNAGGFGVSSSE